MSFHPTRIEMELVSPTEFPSVGKMAGEIWPEVYATIITPSQIQYMLERMYAPETIAREVKEKGIHYYWINLQGKSVGFLAFGPVKSGATCHLHKLYLLSSQQGRGIGSAALNWVIHHLAETEASSLELRVNRHNRAAITCYERNGFKKIAEDCLEIGGGFVMDDYLMSHPLTPDKVDFSIAQGD